MSAAQLLALLPLLVLAGAAVVLLLTVSFWRHHGGVAALTLLALFAALVSIGPSLAVPVTLPLLTWDGFSSYLTALFVGAALVVTILSYRYLGSRSNEPEEYYVLLVAATLGAVTLACANHFASVVLGLEVLSIALYVLIAYPDEGHPPLEASLKYLILSGAASTTLLFGMALVYAASGALDFAGIAEAARSSSSPGDQLLQSAGVMLVLAGLAFKLSLVPLHMWTPDVYQGAPAPVAAFLATVAKGAAFAVLLRFLLQGGVLDATVQGAMVLLAMLSMVVGNLLALRQQHVKRLLACSAIAHLGYLLIPLITLGATDPVFATETVLVYLGAYVVMTLAAFGAVTVLSGPATPAAAAAAAAAEADDVARYQALAWRRPLVAATLVVALLSLAGIPLTLGFIAKFYVFAAGVGAAAWLLLGGLIVGSGLGIYYYLRVVFMIFRTETAAAEAPEGTPAAEAGAAITGQWTLGMLGVLLLIFGIYPEPFIGVVRQALQGWGG